MEMKVLGYVQPYSEESVAHTSDDKDTAEDEDGFFPADLRSRFEGIVSLDEW